MGTAARLFVSDKSGREIGRFVFAGTGPCIFGDERTPKKRGEHIKGFHNVIRVGPDEAPKTVADFGGDPVFVKFWGPGPEADTRWVDTFWLVPEDWTREMLVELWKLRKPTCGTEEVAVRPSA